MENKMLKTISLKLQLRAIRKELNKLEESLVTLEKEDTVEFIKAASRGMARIAIAHKRASMARIQKELYA